MTVKKQEIPAYDPRAIQGIGLNYATANCGGCPRARLHDLAGGARARRSRSTRTRSTASPSWSSPFQNLTAALDACGACLFTTFGIGADELAAMLSAADRRAVHRPTSS